MSEIWRRVRGYEGYYEVSNKGRVKSLERYNVPEDKILTPFKNNRGYLRVPLTRNGKTKNKAIHRLVAFAFLKIDSRFNEVNHIDGDKLNNRVENLEWCNRSHNLKHSFNSKHAFV